MAIILCPECGEKISDKSTACIHCGFPLHTDNTAIDETDILLNDINSILNKSENNEQLFKLLFKGFSSKSLYNRNRIKASAIVQATTGRYRPEAEAINCNEEHVVFDGITHPNAQKIQSVLSQYGCITRILESDITDYSRSNKKIESLEDDQNVLRCPKCKSTAITTGQRGYSLLFGFAGSNRTVNRCGHCGYSWKP